MGRQIKVFCVCMNWHLVLIDWSMINNSSFTLSMDSFSRWLNVDYDYIMGKGSQRWISVSIETKPFQDFVKRKFLNASKISIARLHPRPMTEAGNSLEIGKSFAVLGFQLCPIWKELGDQDFSDPYLFEGCAFQKTWLLRQNWLDQSHMR